MPEMTNETVVQAVIGIVVLSVLIAAAYYVVASFRDYGDDDRHLPGDALANLQEMHLRGDISDEEFRTIKARTRQALDAVDPSPVDSSSNESISQNPTEA